LAKELSFIHAADLHLDSPFKGLSNLPDSIFRQVRDSTFAALNRLVDAAISKQVDFIVIVGDLFDNEKQSLKAQIRLRRAFEKLEEHHINVYLSYGNHDFIRGNSYPVTYPDNVFVFPNETVSHITFEKEGEEMAQLYGFSYEERAVLGRKALEYQIRNESIPYHIAMLHGSIMSNTEHDVYAPFQLTDLTRQNFDYWALGHIHKREILQQSPPIVYPGNIQGRNRKETGTKGCYHVILSDHHAELSFIPLQAIQFQTVSIDVSSCEQIHDLEKDILHTLSEKSGPLLINLELESNRSSLQKWEREKRLEDLIDLINETMTSEQNWKYIFNVKAKVNIDKKAKAQLRGNSFIEELMNHIEQESIHPFIEELYHHKQARKYMEPLSNEDEEEIKEAAKQFLLQELWKG